MNILPKKSWHVRNKDNIAKVRKDEAKAEEERRAKEERKKLAEREARTELLRGRARERIGTKNFIPLSSSSVQDQHTSHVNFFEELENGQEEGKRTNKEHEREKKEEAEKYEKQIGYLTYLGQDTNEALGTKNWYDVFPNRDDQHESAEVDMKGKLKEDPLEVIKKYLPKPFKNKKHTDESVTKEDIVTECKTKKYSKHKTKKEKKSKDNSSHSYKRKKKRREVDSNSSDDSEFVKKKKLELLRIERIKREREERLKAEALFSNMRHNSSSSPKQSRRKYNSQFNPEIARQNQST